MFCSKCGKEISEGAIFCTHCGAPTAPAENTVSAPIYAGSNMPAEPDAALMGAASAPVFAESAVPSAESMPAAVDNTLSMSASMPAFANNVPQNNEAEQAAPVVTAEPAAPVAPIESAFAAVPQSAPMQAAAPVPETALPTAQTEERVYTFKHIAWCLAAVAVMAITAGVFAGLYFSAIA